MSSTIDNSSCPNSPNPKDDAQNGEKAPPKPHTATCSHSADKNGRRYTLGRMPNG
tara:strand:+ start:553 stop:717 length:165 start_codon:yes stop_codon:yes gene_type:complete